MIDRRPENCRFRLQDEGKAYPRSSCNACGKTLMDGLGVSCGFVMAETGSKPFELRKAAGYLPKPEEWCDIASQIRDAWAEQNSGVQLVDIVRVAITIERDDGSRVTFEHDERLRDRGL